MNILAIADRGPQIDFTQVIQDRAVDLVVTLGDLERHDLLGLTQVTHIPKIGVYGNHCSGNYMDELGIMNMHMMTWQFGGLTFGGFQGCVRYKANPDAIMYTQEEAQQMISIFPPVDVFLCHCPPRGINDEDEVVHQGFDALRTYIDTYHPQLLLHGHTYPTEATIVRKHGSTRIEYVHTWRVISV